jgi:small-conductance mechanosensitive channel
LLAVLLLAAAGAVSQPESAPAQTQPAAVTFQAELWNATMDAIERRLERSDPSVREDSTISRRLDEIIQEAQADRDRLRQRQTDLQARLDSLGPPPEGEDALPESPQIADERGRLNQSLTEVKSELSLAELAVTRAQELQARVARMQRLQLVEQLLRHGSVPLDPAVLREFPVQLIAIFAAMGEISADWWAQTKATRGLLETVVRIAGFLILAFGIAYWLRRDLLRRFGARPVTEPPAYTLRLLAAVADGVARGILPAAVLGVIIARTQSETSPLTGAFGDMVGLAAESLMIFVLATALPKSVLSPRDPAWRLTTLKPENGPRILALVTPLALLFSIDEFVISAGEQIPQIGVEMTVAFESVWTFGFNLAQGLIALTLLRPSLWRRDAEIQPDTAQSEGATETADSGDESAGEEAPEDARVRLHDGLGQLFWRLLQGVLLLATLVGTFAPVMGYTNLGNYLLNNILGTAILVSILYILRGLFRELIGYATRSRLLIEKVALPHKTRSRLKLAARFALDFAIVLIGLSVIAPNWGISEGDMLRAARTLLGGFQIGNVTISPSELILSVLVFMLTLALIRALKRSLAEKILPETEIEESVRHSITAGIGYVGFVVAAGLAIAVAGVDLTNIALVAGALSVGIGFGLQNIVNNFVSGLILLIERPIKVGDWVVVGTEQGFVKQINMRATEIETWQKASVIVPNADLLSQSLTNWTHSDKIGRVDVAVGVALNSDIDHVSRVLLEIAHAHPRCRRYPEPVALVMRIGESRIDMEIRLFTSDILWVMWIASDIRKEILRRFPSEGIVIPYAQRVVHISEGDPMAPSVSAVQDRLPGPPD